MHTTRKTPTFVMLAVTVALASGALIAAAQPANAAPAWNVTPSPNPKGSKGTSLSGVSCPSTNTCFAVGSSNGANSKTLVEHWNRTRWSIVASPNPAGSFDPALSAVSCPSTNSCFAVGSYFAGRVTKIETLVEHWNGRGWAIMTSPNPTGSRSSVFSAVSCPSTRSCFAVGDREDHSVAKTLVEHWNGTSWAVMTSPNPAGATSSVLSAVSCPNPRSCFAVGDREDHSVDNTLAEHWNGTSWALMTSPNPGTHLSVLSAASCPSTQSCFAVGRYMVGSLNKTLVEHWNGTSWAIMTSPNPGRAGTFLNGIACLIAKGCVAVGYSNDSPSKSLVEHGDGHSWGVMTSPNPAGATATNLTAVACSSASRCFAVGYFFSAGGDAKSLAERYS